MVHQYTSIDMYKCFTLLEKDILSVPYSSRLQNRIPLADAMAEGWRAAELVAKYRNELLDARVPVTLLDSMHLRAGAFAYCVGVLDTARTEQTSDNDTLKKLCAEGAKLRKKIITLYQFIFGDYPDILQSLRKMRKSRFASDLSRNLMSLVLLGKRYNTILDNAGFDIQLFSNAQSLRDSILQYATDINGQSERYIQKRNTTNRARLYLFDAIGEIYSAGQFYFKQKNDTETASLFTNNFMRKLALLRKNRISKHRKVIDVTAS